MPDPAVVGGAKQQVLSRRVPLDDSDPPRVTNQSLPGLGEALADAARWDVPNPHLKAPTEA